MRTDQIVRRDREKGGGGEFGPGDVGWEGAGRELSQQEVGGVFVSGIQQRCCIYVLGRV